MGKFGQNYRGDTFPKMRTRVEEAKTHILPHFRAYSLRNMHKMGYKMSGPAASERREVGSHLTPFWGLRNPSNSAIFLRDFVGPKWGENWPAKTLKMRVLDLSDQQQGDATAIPRLVPQQKTDLHNKENSPIGGLPQCTVSSVDV